MNHCYHEQGSFARVVGYPTKRLEESLPRKSGGGESQLHQQDFHQCHQNCHQTLTNYHIHGHMPPLQLLFVSIGKQSGLDLDEAMPGGREVLVRSQSVQRKYRI